MSATRLIEFDPLRTLYGAPYIYDDVCLIYPATLGDIAQIGLDEFFRLLQYITIHPPSIGKQFANVSSYDLFVEQTATVEFAKLFRRAISFFLKEDCLLIPETKTIALGGHDGEKFHVLTAEELINIQEIIRQQHWLETKHVRGDADNTKAQEILNKLARSKQRVAELKSKNETSDTSFADLVASMALAVPGLNITNIWDITYYALYDQFYRYRQKDNYETSSRAALAGAKIPKHQLKGWIGPIKNKEE